MLGMVFTEFIELVEEKFSPEMADAVLTEAAPVHGGAYTAVGYYAFEELARMVDILSRRTGVPAPELVRVFGHHLLGRYAQGHASMCRIAQAPYEGPEGTGTLFTLEKVAT